MSGFEIFGVIAGLDGALQGGSKLYKVIQDVVKANDERQEIDNLLHRPGGLMKQLNDCKSLLEDAKKAEKVDKLMFDRFLELDDKKFFEGMTETMNRLEEKLRRDDGHYRHIKRLIWSKSKADIRKFIDNLKTWREDLAWALDWDHRATTRDIHKIVQERHGSEELVLMLQKSEQDHQEEKRAKMVEKILNWLSPLDFDAKHSELLNIENRIDLTHIVVDSIEFQAWRDGKHFVLSCHADAGAGKTVLTSMIIEYLKQKTEGRNIAVLYLYLNHKDQKAQTPANLIGSLLRQLIMCRKPPSASEHLQKLFKAKREGKISLTWPERLSAFREEMKDFRRVMIVVDALDEGSRDVRSKWEQLFPQIPHDNISILTTSRKEEAELVGGKRCDIGGEEYLNLFYVCHDCPEDFHICLKCRAEGGKCPGEARGEDHFLEEPYEGEEVFLSVSPPEEVIRTFVEKEIRSEIKTGRTLRAKENIYKGRVGTTTLGRIINSNPRLEKDIIETVCARANDKFLLAKLWIDTLKQALNKAEVTRALRDLPKGYADTYEQTMFRIADPKVNTKSAFTVAISSVAWIAHAQRALTVDELRHALATNLEKGYEEDELYDQETILDNTHGLLIISDGVVRLTHYTAQEYFNNEGGKWFTFNVPARITCTCLRYMSIEEVSKPFERASDTEGLEFRQQKYPFLAYAYEYWGCHAKDASSDRNTRERILEFLTNADLLNTFVQALWYLESAESWRWEIRTGATALHVAAWFGLVDLVPLLMKTANVDINAKDPGLQQTPLIYAARRGHAETVKKLLDEGASINEVTADDSTAMFEAFSGHNLDVGRILLENTDLDINHTYPRHRNRSLLILIALMVDAAPDEIVHWLEVVLDRKSDLLEVNHCDSSGYTALSFACSCGLVSVIDKLLQHPKINVESENEDGRTPLSFAAGHQDDESAEAMVQQLLKHGANPRARDTKGGGTPAIRAADQGNFGVIGIFYQHEPELIHLVDNGGRGILHAAAIGGQDHIIAPIINMGVKVDTADKKGRTPLHDAARRGKIEVIETLLEYGAISKEDQSHREPWMVAWQNGQTAVLHLLNPEIQPISEDSSVKHPLLDLSKLPLWSLATRGLESLVKDRLRQSPKSFEQPDVDPDSGNTPIHCAIGTGNLSMLNLLVNTPIPTITKNDVGRTPLHTAAHSPNHELIETLLEAIPHNPSTLDAQDIFGDTPLKLAFSWAHRRHCCLLVEAGATIEREDMIRPLFFRAIEYGYIEAVKTLINEYRVPVTAKNDNGDSAVFLAKANGHRELYNYLSRCNTRYVGPISPLSEKSETSISWSTEAVRPAFPQPTSLDMEKDGEIVSDIYTEPKDLEAKFPRVIEAEQRRERVLLPA